MAAGAASIFDKETLRKWLEGQPVKISQLIAQRAALRVFPNVLNIHFHNYNLLTREKQFDLTLQVFRAVLTSGAARNSSTPEVRNAADSALSAARSALSVARSDTRSALDSAGLRAAHFAADSVIHSAADSALSADHSARSAFDSTFTGPDPALLSTHHSADHARSATWESIKFDALAIERGEMRDNMPLWLSAGGNDISAVSLPTESNQLLHNTSQLPEFSPEGKNDKFGLILDWYNTQLESPPRSRFGEEKDIELATQNEEFWEGDAFEVMERVAELVGWPGERKEVDVIGDVEIDLEGLEPQNPVAITFKSVDGVTDVDRETRQGELAADNPAIDRHSEVCRLSDKLVNSFDKDETGANTATGLIEDVKLFSDSLGDRPEEANINLVIPRGDGLRNYLNAHDEKDEMSDLPEISDKYITQLRTLVAAHNLYVSFDPVLDERDLAILGPDVQIITTTPEEGKSAVAAAVEMGIAKPAVEEVLSAEAKVAPKEPSFRNRMSRRAFQSFNNFSSKTLEWFILQIIKGGSKAVSSRPFNATAKWILKEEIWLMANYEKNLI